MTIDENFEEQLKRATAARESKMRTQYEDAKVRAAQEGISKDDFDAALDGAYRQAVRHANSQIIEEAQALEQVNQAAKALRDVYTARILNDGLFTFPASHTEAGAQSTKETETDQLIETNQSDTAELDFNLLATSSSFH